MRLRSGGTDIFYIDESGHDDLFVVTAVRIPFLRMADDGPQMVWTEYLRAAEQWRKAISNQNGIKLRQELHGTKLLLCKGLYHKSGRNLTPAEAVNAYEFALSTLNTVVPDNMILSACATTGSMLFGNKGIHAAMVGLFQRMRKYCSDHDRNGMVFFDEGHPEYTSLYRKSVVHLPSGRNAQNLPLDMFFKDGNTKKSDLSYFIQMADLVAYAALLKRRHENRTLNTKREARGHHMLYDKVAAGVINTSATTKRSDGIAPI